MKNLISWDIYEVASAESLNGVMLRGRIRKLGVENGFNVLAENTEDSENGVRFAVIATEDAEKVIEYLRKVIPDVQISMVAHEVVNPVLSKLKVNKTERYTL